jgi:hypothetical protein
MNNAQQNTVEYFKSNARETGATIEITDDEFGVYIYETKSIEWDNERNMWKLDAEGNAHIL